MPFIVQLRYSPGVVSGESDVMSGPFFVESYGFLYEPVNLPVACLETKSKHTSIIYLEMLFKCDFNLTSVGGGATGVYMG